MLFDDIYRAIGELGTYQAACYVLLAITCIPCGKMTDFTISFVHYQIPSYLYPLASRPWGSTSFIDLKESRETLLVDHVASFKSICFVPTRPLRLYPRGEYLSQSSHRWFIIGSFVLIRRLTPESRELSPYTFKIRFWGNFLCCWWTRSGENDLLCSVCRGYTPVWSASIWHRHSVTSIVFGKRVGHKD